MTPERDDALAIRPGAVAMSAHRRRALLRVLAASGASVAAAAVLVPVVTASGMTGAPSGPGAMDGQAPGPMREVLFEEMYRGSHISGRRLGDDEQPPPDRYGHTHVERVEVLIDGRRLHLMRRADGSYLSMVDHFSSYPNALAAARGAVDALGTSRLPREDTAGPATGAGQAGSRTPAAT
ncbi:tyrosinase cofactor [Streptomyces odontomachi]|uniref:tyrosinase cofactor n=1 Tax=Streptomyces odontomachi TaxID=2944940 RepID=UPI00210E5455|nr:tyrosinase cofactor [Streptomyces sp. ODS25]